MAIPTPVAQLAISQRNLISSEAFEKSRRSNQFELFPLLNVHHHGSALEHNLSFIWIESVTMQALVLKRTA